MRKRRSPASKWQQTVQTPIPNDGTPSPEEKMNPDMKACTAELQRELRAFVKLVARIRLQALDNDSHKR